MRDGVEEGFAQFVGPAQDFGLRRLALEAHTLEREPELVRDGGEQTVIRGTELARSRRGHKDNRPDGLAATVTWYKENRAWWEPLKARHAG